MRVKLGETYQHKHQKTIFKVIGWGQSDIHGNCFIGETSDGELIPIRTQSSQYIPHPNVPVKRVYHNVSPDDSGIIG